jgi:hypothetical protein
MPHPVFPPTPPLFSHLRYGPDQGRRAPAPPLREQEAAFIALAALAGALAGLSTNLLGFLAHAMQQVFYGLEGNRLSALAEIRHPGA